MSDQRNLLGETAERVLSALEGTNFAADSRMVEEVGLPSVLIEEQAGGYGGNWDDVFLIVKIAGRSAAPLPIGEMIVAKWLTQTIASENPGAASLAATVQGQCTGNRFTGALGQVPWGRHAADVVAVLDDTIVLLNREHAMQIDARENIAGEPRDVLHFRDAPARVVVAEAWNDKHLFRTVALIRAAQIAGALDAALSLAVQYTRERKQFGRPLAAFQAIQQQLAVLAEEAAAANMAAAAGFHALSRGDAVFECAAAKLRANQAAAVGASIAHQVHGAMGFTQEYPLQKVTRRLWAWRSEFGNERHWAAEIGARVAARGADNFWPDLVAAG